MPKYYKAQKHKTGQTGLMSSSYLPAELASVLDSSNSVCRFEDLLVRPVSTLALHMQSEYLIRISSPEPIERGSELSKANLPSAET